MRTSRFEALLSLIRACKNSDGISQKKLYSCFYGYGMSIALRYSKNKEEALEILNDAFLKIFVGGIQKYDESANAHEGAFKIWLKRIIIHTAIDYYRKNQKHYYLQNMGNEIPENTFTVEPDIMDTLPFEEMLGIIKRLSPAYCTVFCMHVIDGYTHEQIAKQLGISAGTSKSNLAKARMRLREMIQKEYKDEYARYTGS